MPGIVGLITKQPRTWAEPQLQRMLETIRHESFYETGTWIDEAAGIYVGWAVIENSFCSCNPIRNEKGDAVLLFSGEDFPDPETPCRLKKRGHQFEMEGAEYLVHLYEEEPSFLASLNGRFQGLLLDRNRGTATLFNDRYGMHRVYYHEAKEGFYFAPEAKAILAVRPELRRPNARSFGEFVSFGSVLENRTLFENLNVLPSGSAWVFRNGALQQKSSYFQKKDWEDQAPLDPESYYRQVLDVYTRTLPRYFKGREGIGMSLTGGLDTRVVLAWRKAAPGELPCYTYGGNYRDCQDVQIARRVAAVCQQPHHVITVGKDFLSRFAHYAERAIYLSDACVDMGRAPDLFVSERARQIAPLRMTGLYGDEVLRHLVAFKPGTPAPGLFTAEIMNYVDQARRTYQEQIRQHPLSFSVFCQAPWAHYGIRSLEQTQVTARTPFLDNELVKTVFRAPKNAAANNDLRLRLIADGNPELRKIPTDRGYGGNNGPMSEAIYHAYLEFFFKAEYAYDYGMPQWVAQVDHVFAPLHLERLFLGRHKLYHFRVWYRDTLAPYVREVLLDPRALSRPYVERKVVENVVNGHLKGNHNYTTELHKLLTLELVHRLFLDSQ
jgi:asparagine synthase (glutamine-hydrolysing)